ncbi:MAG: hypothetical protein OEW75_12585, partial [Cyclobacteriaceae bacterium]|nr:hypothetical protein [Cyclobacteriaceae bacterium]
MGNAKNIKKSGGYFSPIAAVFLLLVAFILFSPMYSYAQEGTSRQKKVKVRSSVDRKRRGDRAVKPDRF